jgi:hypothetical protein
MACLSLTTFVCDSLAWDHNVRRTDIQYPLAMTYRGSDHAPQYDDVHISKKCYNYSMTISLWPCSPCVTWPFFPFLNLYTVGRTPWTGDQPVARPLPTQRTTQTQNKHTQTSMPRVGYEPMIPVFERAKTLYALDRAAIVIGITVWLYYSITCCSTV